jgi:transposase
LEKNGVKKTYKKADYRWSRDYRLRLAPATAKAYQDASWGLKRASADYIKLAKSKKELARRCVNYVLGRTKKVTQCNNNIIVIEDLNVLFFHGRGTRAPGWLNYFLPRLENRWLIQALHRAFSDLAVHRGMYVIEAAPARTSITCPACTLCDADSRHGERFLCRGCGATYHADLEVATANLTRVALTGEPMPRPRERGRDAQNTGSARNPKCLESIVNKQ